MIAAPSAGRSSLFFASIRATRSLSAPGVSGLSAASDGAVDRSHRPRADPVIELVAAKDDVFFAHESIHVLPDARAG